MRTWLGGLAAFAAAVLAFIAPGKQADDREQEPRVRRLNGEGALRDLLLAEQYARAASLWLDSRFVECRLPSVYSYDGPEAYFEALIKVTVRVSDRPLRRTMAGALETAANDAAPVTKKIVVMPGASPAVRVLKTAMFERDMAEAA